MSAKIITGDVMTELAKLPAGHFDCAVTSPPYWKLRSYLPAEHADKAKELGQEPSLQGYLENCLRWTAQVKRVLSDRGIFWLNIGDSYKNSGCGGGGGSKQHTSPGSLGATGRREGAVGDQYLVPERLLIALQGQGWIVRNKVVWHKPSAMPSSVRGWRWERCRVKVKASEQASIPAAERRNYNVPGAHANRSTPHTKAQWADCPGCPKCSATDGMVLRKGAWRPTDSYEPVYMLVKEPDYYSHGVRIPAAAATIERNLYTRITDDAAEQSAVRHDHETDLDDANLRNTWLSDLGQFSKGELLSLLGCNANIWTIPAESAKRKHYAAFPSELVYRCLAGSVSPGGYCSQCGEPFAKSDRGDFMPTCDCVKNDRARGILCPTPRAPRVLDPFSGIGRTALECCRLGLDFTGIELNEEFAAASRQEIAKRYPMTELY